MPVIGITGGLATGKSSVTRLLHGMGAIVFSADEAARAVVSSGSSVLQNIVSAFGPDVLRPDATLDRTTLGKRIFADPLARERLNKLLHPPIRRLLHSQIESAQTDFPHSVIAVEVPLLYEGGMENWFDAILVVTASEAVQIARLRERNGLSEAEARLRIAAQWPLKEKERRADFVLVNNGPFDDLRQGVETLWSRWMTEK